MSDAQYIAAAILTDACVGAMHIHPGVLAGGAYNHVGMDVRIGMVIQVFEQICERMATLKWRPRESVPPPGG